MAPKYVAPAPAGGRGAAAPPVVVPVATFDSPPNTASTFRPPRYATSSKLYVVLAARPSTVQLRFAPIAVPVSGVAHVPRFTLGVDPPQLSAEREAYRRS